MLVSRSIDGHKLLKARRCLRYRSILGFLSGGAARDRAGDKAVTIAQGQDRNRDRTGNKDTSNSIA